MVNVKSYGLICSIFRFVHPVLTRSNNVKVKVRNKGPMGYTKGEAIIYIGCIKHLTLSMLRLLSFKAQESKYLGKLSKPCHVGIHWIALAEYSQMSTHVPGFQPFFKVF